MNLYRALALILCALSTQPALAANEKLLARGQQLYKSGDYSKGIAACIACHGPKATGNAQAGFPNLSGQNAPYMQKQLKDFKLAKRTNDLNRIMQTLTKQMSDEDMQAVSQYIENLH